MNESLQPNEFFSFLIISILLMLTFALVLVAFFFRYQRKLLREKMAQQELEIKYQEELLFSTIETQEKERKRIAKDLHDDIGSKLNVVLLGLYQFRKQTKDLPEAKAAIKNMSQLLNKTIDSTRRISHDLLPPTLDSFGLSAAILELAENYDNTGEVNIEYHDSEAEHRITDKLVELNLFRVVQELVKNSIVHGKSENIEIKLVLQPEHFEIDYKDDGKGFDMSVMKKKKGLGTQNIESRLNMSNASIEYQSAIGEGVKAFIRSKTAVLSE